MTLGFRHSSFRQCKYVSNLNIILLHILFITRIPHVRSFNWKGLLLRLNFQLFPIVSFDLCTKRSGPIFMKGLSQGLGFNVNTKVLSRGWAVSWIWALVLILFMAKFKLRASIRYLVWTCLIWSHVWHYMSHILKIEDNIFAWRILYAYILWIYFCYWNCWTFCQQGELSCKFVDFN